MVAGFLVDYLCAELMKKTVYLFDFDGTITTKDTFIEVIRHAKGTWKWLFGFLLFSPILVLMKLHLYPNWKAKQRIFAYFFKGMTIEVFDELCRNFAAVNRHLLRPKALETIAEARKKGEVCVVSASIDNWVRPFLPDIKIVGTQIEVLNGLLTGHFTTPNCYGREKVNRIERVLTSPRSELNIIAFGDSRGDYEMLKYADEAHYKPFRT